MIFGFQRWGEAIELSKWKKVPVMKEHSIIPWIASLNSEGSPCLPRHVTLAEAAYNLKKNYFYCSLKYLYLGGIDKPIGVLKNPGVIQITLIPNFPTSLAIGRVIPSTAPLDAL